MFRSKLMRFSPAVPLALAAGVLFALVTGHLAPRVVWAQGNSILATATVTDTAFSGSTPAIRSDNGGSYEHEAAGVSCHFTSSGHFVLRTQSSEGLSLRGIAFDFTGAYYRDLTRPCCQTPEDGDGGGVLDICGSGGPCSTDNVARDVRIIASDFFKRSSSSTSLRMLFSMQGDFDGDSDFQLIFVNKVPVAVQPDGSRMLTAAGDSARAELYKYVAGNAGQPKPVLLGIYNMPFQLTASPL